ncbi:MAG: 1-deoxy-D-xylulose-5-phosphate synthase [Oscillospiraceae bacterium]|nr:1-deoxy-D-xylulose-5-phosphate synthase [Oscillospiraceae bacterium]
MSVLDRINSPEDLRKLDPEELDILCDEIRAFLVDNISKTGGHLAPNLGIVEITLAIHQVFDTARDRLVFDVGHQCYVHKMITGRRDCFDQLRKLNGIAGFPKPVESIHDAFIAGHASTSVSAALGMARARTLMGEDYSVIALIGDGALTGGLAYEGLNDAGASGEPLIVVLNDNGMSITKNVGGIAHYLAGQRIKPSYLRFKKIYKKLLGRLTWLYNFNHGIKESIKHSILPSGVFESLGFQYIGPVDGHDIEKMTQALRTAKEMRCPVLIHAITTKGKGCAYSEENPDTYHGVSGFDPITGTLKSSSPSFSSVFGDKLTDLADQNKRIMAITAAMTSGTGLTSFASRHPSRFFDVGIAEGHSVTMAAGAAKQGMIPVFAVYSSFLQRAYDMLIHDIAISGLHVVLAVDRAGLVGDDGETHQGQFDVAYLSTVPGLVVLSPSSFAELRAMLTFAVEYYDHPVAVRYPRGGEGRYTDGGLAPSKLIRTGEDITLITYGISINDVLDAADSLKEKGISAEVLKLDFVNPIDYRSVRRSVRKTGRVIVVEECNSEGCVGQRIAADLNKHGIMPESLILKNLGSGFVEHGTQQQLRRLCGIDAESIVKAALECVSEEQEIEQETN